MQFSTLFAVLPLLASMAVAHPVRRHSVGHAKREVPQEHSHEQFLTTVRASLALNNPNKISDPVFGLLGNAAAAGGQGLITNTDCLQQATADQAFTNAKAAGDVAGQTAALIYRALERNTGAVGKASVLCTETAANPEIAAVSQHQDPASTGAAATNKAITLALAKQIASVGGNPQDALKSGTFAPGDLGDNTAKGNTCDDANDAEGCIFTQNLLVEDATAAEIDAAVAGIAPAAGGAAADTTDIATAAPAATAVPAGCPAVVGDVSSAVVTDVASAGVTDVATAISSAAPAVETGAASSGTPAAGIDVGQCTDFSMTFAAGLDGRKATEFSFEPSDLTNFNHGTALNGQIITQFMCDTFVNACGKSASTRDACSTAKAGIDAQKVAGTLANNQDYADAWLSALESTFGIKSTGTGSAGGVSAPPADTAPAPDAASSDSTATSSAIDASATSVDATPAPAGNNAVAAAGIDVGPCTGLQGRKATEFSFEPTDLTNFNHGTALNGQIITQFMCDTFVNACGRSASTRDACSAAKAGIDAQKVAGTLRNNQDYADAWLSAVEGAFGIKSTGTGTGSGAAAPVAAAPTASESAVSSEVAAPAVSSAAAAPAATAAPAAAAGNNVQTFTGALNGVAALPVIQDTSSNRPFSVNGNTFVNKAAAIQRSCDIQNNACSNAFNSGKGTSDVGACNAQQAQCNAAA